MGCLNRAHSFGRRVGMMETGLETVPFWYLPEGVVTHQSLKAAARGFRNFHNYRIRILFFCGKLNLCPL